MKPTHITRLSTLGFGTLLLAASVSAQDDVAPLVIADVPAEPPLKMPTTTNDREDASTTAKSAESTSSTASNKVGRFATAFVAGEVHAKFSFTWEEGMGVRVQIANMTNFGDMDMKNYSYSINTNTVSGDQTDEALRCAGTQGILDPAKVTANAICDPILAEYCQLGDLSGKHGRINATRGGKPKDISYLEEYVRFFPQAFSLLGRSVVITGYDGKRLACGNIISVLDGTADEAGLPTDKKSNYQNDYPSEAYKPPTTAFGVGINGKEVNSKGFADASLAVPPKVPAASEAVGLRFLTTAGGKATILTTSYASTGTALPSEAATGDAYATTKIVIGLGLGFVVGSITMLI